MQHWNSFALHYNVLPDHSVTNLSSLKQTTVSHSARPIAFDRSDNNSYRPTFLFFLWPCGPTRAMASSFTRFLGHTQGRIIVGRTTLDEWSARRRDLYLTTHNTHNRQTSMPAVGIEPTISAGERPQTYALDRAATGTGRPTFHNTDFSSSNWKSSLTRPIKTVTCAITVTSVLSQIVIQHAAK